MSKNKTAKPGSLHPLVRQVVCSFRRRDNGRSYLSFGEFGLEVDDSGLRDMAYMLLRLMVEADRPCLSEEPDDLFRNNSRMDAVQGNIPYQRESIPRPVPASGQPAGNENKSRSRHHNICVNLFCVASYGGIRPND